MPDQLITGSSTDRDGKVVYLAGPWGVMTAARAIVHIELDLATFFMLAPDGSRINVSVITRALGRELWASGDDPKRNLLAELTLD